MRDGAAGERKEYALSEVVGFVLIIGLIVVVASLYLTYGVPAQGRENEILHMNFVKDQFVSYKLSLDSLFNNNKVGTTVSNSFNLGTSGGYSQGSVGFIPVMSPINSGGTFAINPVGPDQRVTENETLDITAYALILNESDFSAVDLPAQISFTPSHVYLNISGIQQSDLNKDSVFGVTANTTDWRATVNLTPKISFYQNYMTEGKSPPADCPTSANGSVLTVSNTVCLIPMNIYNYTQSDLTISITKGNIDTMQNYAVYQNVIPGPTYTIDLMDDAYGLKSVTTPPQYIDINTDIIPVGSSMSATGNITYNFAETSPYVVSPIPLGSIEYQAQNNYWIPQKYYYQMGGVFLRQSDGNTTYKLPPEITFSYPSNSNILTVNINALSIDPNLPGNHGIVAGSGPLQIKTTLQNITMIPFVPGTANTKTITICIDTTDDKARTMWRNYFDYTAKVAVIPTGEYDPAYFDGTKSCIKLKGYDNDPVNDAYGDYDIYVIASNATYETAIHGVGGIVQ